jgi:hypothetical protein
MGRRGPKPKGAAYHIRHGYYRPSRHGPRPKPVKDQATSDAWAVLRLPIAPAAPRSLDPIEELLQREGIDITDEDRTPKR